MRTSIILRTVLTMSLVVASTLTQAKETGSIGITQDESAVINGTAGSTTTYPWMGFLATDGQQFCGASLISPTWVLTAGHCFLNEAGDTVDIETGALANVVLGSDTVEPLASGGVNASIASIQVHPSYNPDEATSPNKDDFDIALVELTEAVSFQPVQLLSSDAAAIAAGTQARIMGWGTTGVDENNMSINASNELLTALQQIVSQTACADVYGGAITDNMICAGGLTATDTTDTCQGDSGGPLVIANGAAYVQVGLSSFGGTETGPTCGDPDAPGVYARVSALTDFIQQHVTDANFVTLNTGGSTGGGSTGGGTETPTQTASMLSTSVSGTNVTLTWTEATGATGYRLYYAPYPAQSPVASLDMGAALNISAELPVGSNFYVAIEPYNESGSLAISNIEVFMVTGNPTTTESSMLTAAEVEAACTGDFDTSETDVPLTFQIDGTRAIFRGLIDADTPAKVQSLIDNNPEVRVIVLAYGPGSADDDANLEAALKINQAGLGTCVPDNGEIYSGAVDFFLSGVVRRIGNNAILGVHSWGGDVEGADLPMDDPQHQPYLDFYSQIGVSADFYWFTLQAAPANGMHNMTAEEIVTYMMETP